MITFGSLFAGIGGFDLGFERASMVCKWQVEIDDYATRVLEKHWPNVHRERDIRQCGKHNLELVDVICGGPPCQPISLAGKQQGKHDERWLWGEAIRVVCEVGPRIAVMENPSALLGWDDEFGEILERLAAGGYCVEWDCIPSGSLGTHFRRDRVFVVASRSKPSGVRWERVREAKNRTWSEQQFERLVEHELQVCVPCGKSNRVSDGVRNRVDRLRGLGNAVVPQVAEFVGRMVVDALQQG